MADETKRLQERMDALERQHNARWEIERDTRERMLALERSAPALERLATSLESTNCYLERQLIRIGDSLEYLQMVAGSTARIADILERGDGLKNLFTAADALKTIAQVLDKEQVNVQTFPG